MPVTLFSQPVLTLLLSLWLQHTLRIAAKGASQRVLVVKNGVAESDTTQRLNNRQNGFSKQGPFHPTLEYVRLKLSLHCPSAILQYKRKSLKNFKKVTNENLHRELYSVLCGDLNGKEKKKNKPTGYKYTYS